MTTHRQRSLFLAAGLLSAAGLMLLVVLGSDGSGASLRTLDSFHFVASVEVKQEEDSGHPAADRIEGWYKADDRSRWEFSDTDPRLRDQGTIIISDGGSRWTYDGRTNTYSRTPLSADPQRNAASLPTISIILGPLPATDLASFFDQWQNASWEVIGEESLLGQDVQVIEVTSSEGGRSTFWVDPEFAFVLRHVSEAEMYSLRAEVTELEYNNEPSDDLFRFEPPPGSQETDSTSGPSAGSLGPIGGPEVRPPPGFLAPSYLPDAFLNSGEVSTHAADGRVTAHEVRLSRTRGGSPELVIEQQFRAGGLPASLTGGLPVSVDGNPGFRSTVGGEEILVWASGDIVVTVRSAALPFEELLRIAEGMR
ncbi:MAG: DUF2092 domain-containing protein [Dehalococcoidia bacterium]|nr:DUF2092 domain-containing protein [Dehalococcoidia bacterium]